MVFSLFVCARSGCDSKKKRATSPGAEALRGAESFTSFTAERGGGERGARGPLSLDPFLRHLPYPCVRGSPLRVRRRGHGGEDPFAPPPSASTPSSLSLSILSPPSLCLVFCLCFASSLARVLLRKIQLLTFLTFQKGKEFHFGLSEDEKKTRNLRPGISYSFHF